MQILPIKKSIGINWLMVKINYYGVRPLNFNPIESIEGKKFLRVNKGSRCKSHLHKKSYWKLAILYPNTITLPRLGPPTCKSVSMSNMLTTRLCAWTWEWLENYLILQTE